MSAKSAGAEPPGVADATPPEQDVEEPATRPVASPVLDRTLRVAGLVVSILAAIFSGLLELFFTQLRLGGVPIGASILLAVLANVAIAWFAVTATGRRWALGPPWAVWTLLMLFAAGVRTAEGDYLLGGDNWVALVMILVGSLAFAVYAYRMILSRSPVTKL